MTIDEEFPKGSIVINKRTKKRHRIVSRIDVTHVPFHYFELVKVGETMRIQWDYFTLKEKFILEGREQNE